MPRKYDPHRKVRAIPQVIETGLFDDVIVETSDADQETTSPSFAEVVRREMADRPVDHQPFPAAQDVCRAVRRRGLDPGA